MLPIKKYIFLGAIMTAIFVLPLASHALTVGPVKLEYSVNPGDVMHGEMIVQNEGNVLATFYPSFERFTEENGEKKFTAEESDLSTWFSIQQNVTLKPSEQKTIPFSVSIPKDASPGGHYAVIWWSTAPPAGGQSQVSIVTRAGVLVYVRVSGNIVEKGSVVGFLINGAENFFHSAPLELSLAFKNEGNVHLKPTGSLVLKNIFGTERAKLALNPYGLQVLPQTNKSLAVQWTPDSFHPFGFYKASYDIVFGESEQQASDSRWIFIFSWVPFIWTLIVVLVFVGLPIGIKKYNSWIIRKSKSF